MLKGVCKPGGRRQSALLIDSILTPFSLVNLIVTWGRSGRMGGTATHQAVDQEGGVTCPGSLS